MIMKCKICHLTVLKVLKVYKVTYLSVMSLEDDYKDISEEVEIFKESEDRSETYTEFPNDAYKDLMILVTKQGWQ